MKRRELLSQMARITRSYGIDFDKDHPARGGRHDRFRSGGYSVEVPRHAVMVEYTARGILRTFVTETIGISAEVALPLDRALGTTPGFWTQAEAAY